MTFRYFDAEGQQLTREQLNAMRIVTPAMEHVFATVMECVVCRRLLPDLLIDYRQPITSCRSEIYFPNFLLT